MTMLMLPTSSVAVREYRFHRANRFLAKDYNTDVVDFTEKMDSEGVGVSAMVKFLHSNKHKWSGLWTNHYGPEGRSLAELFKNMGCELVVDIDDWFHEVPAGNMSVDAWQGKRKRWYQELLDLADRVTVSTKLLHDKHGGTICPNFIDLSEWYEGEYYGKKETIPRRIKKKDDEVLIVSCAGAGRAGDWRLADRVLQKALELPNTKALFMNYMPQWALEYPLGKIVWCRWVPHRTYPNMLYWLNPDIIISPMEHNDFNAAKSNLKWLEAGAVSACFLGERWGEYERTIEDGVDGVLADGMSEWEDRLLTLCTDHVMRNQIAVSGHKTISHNWTWPAVSDAWARGVLGEGVKAEAV